MPSMNEVTIGVPRVAPQQVHDLTPALGRFSDAVLFGNIWERPELAKRDRSLVTVSALIATGAFSQLTGHFGRALDNGLSPTALSELVTHVAFYAGWPGAMSAVKVLGEVLIDRGLGGRIEGSGATARTAETPAEAQSGLIEALLAKEIDPLLHQELWTRAGLSPRDRGLATIAMMIAQSQWDHIAIQATAALDQGLAPTELAETVLHLAFYLGIPRARSAAAVLDPLLAKRRH